MTVQEEMKELVAAATREDLESALEDADQVTRDALAHQRAAYEGRIALLCAVIAELGDCYFKLTDAFLLLSNVAEVNASPELLKVVPELVAKAQATLEKFQSMPGRLKAGVPE